MAKKGYKPWNLGLTKETDSRVASYAIKGGQTRKGKKNFKLSKVRKDLFAKGILKPPATKGKTNVEVFGFEKAEVIRKKNSESKRGRRLSPASEFKPGHDGSKLSILLKGRHLSSATEFRSGKAHLLFGKKRLDVAERNIRLYKGKTGVQRYGEQRAQIIGKRTSDTKKKKFEEHPEEKERMRLQRLNQVFPKENTEPCLWIQDQLIGLNVSFESEYLVLNELGKPRHRTDIFLTDFNICVEFNGCWWHGCLECYNVFKLMESIQGVERLNQIHKDHQLAQRMLHKGCRIIYVWGHDTQKLNFNILDFLPIDVKIDIAFKQAKALKHLLKL